MNSDYTFRNVDLDRLSVNLAHIILCAFLNNKTPTKNGVENASDRVKLSLLELTNLADDKDPLLWKLTDLCDDLVDSSLTGYFDVKNFQKESHGYKRAIKEVLHAIKKLTKDRLVGPVLIKSTCSLVTCNKAATIVLKGDNFCNEHFGEIFDPSS